MTTHDKEGKYCKTCYNAGFNAGYKTCEKKFEIQKQKNQSKNKIRRKVVCVFGKFDETSDFVVEPACSIKCKCEVCKDSFWIEGEKQ